MTALHSELGRIFQELRTTPIENNRFRVLYAAAQALAWVDDPDMFSSPLDMIEGRTNSQITGSFEVTGDCPSGLNPA